MLLSVAVNPEPFVHLIEKVYAVDEVNFLNVYSLSVPLSVQVAPPSLLYSYLTIPVSASKHDATIVACAVFIELTDISADEDVECSVFMPIVESTNAREDRLGLGSKIVERTLTEEEDDEDIYPLTGNGAFADFEDLIRDSFVQIIPSTPLCSPDCQGLCPQCGVNLNDYPDHHHEEHDDRWDVLEQLKKDLEKNQK